MPSYDRPGLTAAGFSSWRSVADLRSAPDPIPAQPGVYVVLHDRELPTVLDTSTGGRFKGRDPRVAREVLEARLRADTSVLYIGKADLLRRRLVQLFRFGAGTPIGHWGGRYLWQLAGAEQLLVAWRVDPDPIAAEAELLNAYFREFGALPFANLRF